MRHTAKIDPGIKDSCNRSLLRRAMGQFYTPKEVCKKLVKDLLKYIDFSQKNIFRVIDPFCGDGRLLTTLLEQANGLKIDEGHTWEIYFWDYDDGAVQTSQKNIESAARKARINIKLFPLCHDSFLQSEKLYKHFDCVITNPPWENIKPDRRELKQMDRKCQKEYAQALREYDAQLADLLPLSQPVRKFAGWGTNLSRCGTELSLKLLADDGICGIVLPLSFLMDQMSVKLREWFLKNYTLLNVTYYPAEANLFEDVDQNFISMLAVNERCNEHCRFDIDRYDNSKNTITKEGIEFTMKALSSSEYCIPVNFGNIYFEMLDKWKSLDVIEDLENDEQCPLWIGRELDETRHQDFLSQEGKYAFLKGRMVDRFRIKEKPCQYVREDLRSVPETALHYRIAWRDVSRRSQIRRMKATIIHPEIVTGNSLHVGYFLDDNLLRLRALLCIMNSIPFEFQIRSRLGTGHISLGVIRCIHVPPLKTNSLITRLNTELADLNNRPLEAELRIEVITAQAYGLNRHQYSRLLECFDRLPNEFKQQLLSHELWNKIPNHYSAKLSKLDLDIAKSVPPGGNWKDVPATVPSKRIKQIRESYAAGKGSRSTYYGRLREDKPSYTINTYFNRPGNGCHLHYDYEGGQHRVLSQREAARLQSFPDNFIFYGSKGKINKQIGNAVPPILSYQVARCFPHPGQFIDLFCGAGGLSLGFKWAGWEPIVANDIVDTFLETYSKNIHNSIVCGDIREEKIFEALTKIVREKRKNQSNCPLVVLGGPPCQGFSTAGKRRSMNDQRNLLFHRYKAFLAKIKPTWFIFENVLGLLNMSKGKVFEMIKQELEATTSSIVTWKLQAECYGVPQRRTRVLIVGSMNGAIDPPAIITAEQKRDIFEDSAQIVTVGDALSDLPPLTSGEDGSSREYCSEPQNAYQLLMRSHISIEDYLCKLRRDKSVHLRKEVAFQKNVDHCLDKGKDSDI